MAFNLYTSQMYTQICYWYKTLKVLYIEFNKISVFIVRMKYRRRSSTYYTVGKDSRIRQFPPLVSCTVLYKKYLVSE